MQSFQRLVHSVQLGHMVMGTSYEGPIVTIAKLISSELLLKCIISEKRMILSRNLFSVIKNDYVSFGGLKHLGSIEMR